MRILLWRALALLALATALLGVLLPGLPTVEFLLLAAWAAGRGWPALERWLLAHPRFGPPIQRWRQQGAISRQAKWMATLTMLLSVALILLSPLPHWASGLLALTMLMVLLWLWRRPEPKPPMPGAGH